MEYKVKALKVSSINGYIVTLEEYSLPEKYTTYRVHLHIPGIKQIFKDYPSTAISAADRYSEFNDDYKAILDTYADWVVEINNISTDEDTIEFLNYPKYVDPDKDRIPYGYSLLKGTIEHDIEINIEKCLDKYNGIFTGTLKFSNGDIYYFKYDYNAESTNITESTNIEDLIANDIFECYDLNGNYINCYDVFIKYGYNIDTFGSTIEDIIDEKVDKFLESKENNNASAT